MNQNDIILSDTNIVLRLMLFSKIDLCGFEIPGYGKLKFHHIVIDEVKRWIDRDNKKRRVRVIDKFGRKLVENALKAARKNVQAVTTVSEDDLELKFRSYRAIAEKIDSNSADPSDEDLLVLLHAEQLESYMLSNDHIMYKLGQKVIGAKSLELEDIFIALIRAELITKEDVEAYAKILDSYDEVFNLTKVLGTI